LCCDEPGTTLIASVNPSDLGIRRIGMRILVRLLRPHFSKTPSTRPKIAPNHRCAIVALDTVAVNQPRSGGRSRPFRWQGLAVSIGSLAAISGRAMLDSGHGSPSSSVCTLLL